MAEILMRLAEPGEIPPNGGTALQENPAKPVFSGNGPDDYVCASCGNLLARAMPPEYMNRKLRIKCGRCRTINVAVEIEGIDYGKAFGRRPADG
jgi:phage FluMu protein Com